MIDRIDKLCDYILFDCIWGGLGQFTPIMNHLSPLNLDFGSEDPGILVAQSLHKQQAGMGRASQILKKDVHIKGQKRYADHRHFNYVYLKFVASGYPYPLYASLTVNSCLTSGEDNKKWWDKVPRLGIGWRKELVRKSKLLRPLVAGNFEDISTDGLVANEKYWDLEPNNL